MIFSFLGLLCELNEKMYIKDGLKLPARGKGRQKKKYNYCCDH